MWFDDLLACPDCGRPLSRESVCTCGFVPRGRDWRPLNPRPREITFDVRGTTDLTNVDIAKPKITYAGPRAIRDSSELFSAAAPHLERGERLLDLGCGPRDQAIPAEHFGLQYAGIDYTSDEADLLADAHALPFASGTFDAILSYAVLEHLYNPFLAAREAARVLRSGGIFFGTVSQGEPFHDSFFHHTAFGVLTVFEQAGFDTKRLWPSYDTLHALSGMGRYPRATRLVIEAVHRFASATPFLAPRKYVKGSPREKALDALHRAASICFVAFRR